MSILEDIHPEELGHVFEANDDDPKLKQVQIHVNGRIWRCPDCGSNVQTELSPLFYECNGCRSRWRGVK